MSGPGESWHAIKKFLNPILKFRHPAVIWGLLYSKGYSGNGCSNAIKCIIKLSAADARDLPALWLF